MGIDFGHLVKLTGVTYFRLSPHEQKAFAGAIDGAGRLFKRFISNFVTVAPPFMITYMLQSWATEENMKLHRKNPKDFENDT